MSSRKNRLERRAIDPKGVVMPSRAPIDIHSVRVAAPVEWAFQAVLHLWHRHLGRSTPRAFRSLWGLEPDSGFEIAEEEAPSRLVLVGRHRFSDYELAFEVAPEGEGALVTARTSADFPGLAGRLYRAAVIGSGGHALAVRWMLRSIRRAAERFVAPRPR